MSDSRELGRSPGRPQALSAGVGGQRPAGEARPLEGVLEAEGWWEVRLDRQVGLMMGGKILTCGQ